MNNKETKHRETKHRDNMIVLSSADSLPKDIRICLKDSRGRIVDTEKSYFLRISRKHTMQVVTK